MSAATDFFTDDQLEEKNLRAVQQRESTDGKCNSSRERKSLRSMRRSICKIVILSVAVFILGTFVYSSIHILVLCNASSALSFLAAKCKVSLSVDYPILGSPIQCAARMGKHELLSNLKRQGVKFDMSPKSLLLIPQSEFNTYMRAGLIDRDVVFETALRGARNGDKSLVDVAMQRLGMGFESDVKLTGINSQTTVIGALIKYDLDGLVIPYLKRNNDVRIKWGKGRYNAIGLAASFGSKNVVRGLIKNNLLSVDSIGLAPYWAVERGHRDVLDTLLSWRDINDRRLIPINSWFSRARDYEGKVLLSYAATRGNVDMCAYLIGRGADPNVEPKLENGNLAWSPFEYACMSGQVKIVKLMLSQWGAKMSKWAFQKALEKDRQDVVAYFLDEKLWKMRAGDMDKAAAAKAENTVRYLIAKGYKFSGANSLNAACQRRDIKWMNIILDGQSPYGNAAKVVIDNNDANMLKSMIERNRNPLLIASRIDGSKGLLDYAWKKSKNCKEYLIARGAKLYSSELLEDAAKKNDFGAVKMFCERFNSPYGKAPHIAVWHSNTKLLDYFVRERKLGPEYREADWGWLLPMAAGYGTPEAVAYLLNQGADVNRGAGPGIHLALDANGHRRKCALEEARANKKMTNERLILKARGNNMVDPPLTLTDRASWKNARVLIVTNSSRERIALKLRRNGGTSDDIYDNNARSISGLGTQEYGWEQLSGNAFDPNESGVIEVSEYARKCYFKFDGAKRLSYWFDD